MNGGDGGIDNLASALVQDTFRLIACLIRRVFKPMLALVYPFVGLVVAGVRDAQESLR